MFPGEFSAIERDSEMRAAGPAIQAWILIDWRLARTKQVKVVAGFIRHKQGRKVMAGLWRKDVV